MYECHSIINDNAGTVGIVLVVGSFVTLTDLNWFLNRADIIIDGVTTPIFDSQPRPR